MSNKDQRKTKNKHSLSRSDFLKWGGLGVGASVLPAFGQQNDAGAVELSNFLFTVPEGVKSRMTSPENPTGAKGKGAIKNKGAKGRAFVTIPAGESVDMLNVQGAGIVNRIKLTTSNRSPKMLRTLRIDMFWDGANKPAVSVPMGDFFGVGLGRTASFVSDFFSNPEGRSFNCFIPMPFKKAARITISNESEQLVHHLFYNVSYQEWEQPFEKSLYFHGFWNRNTKTSLTEDYKILPRVHGKGRFLGTNMGVEANHAYGDLWWGEGEVKMYLDGDTNYPTIVGTGTEDYIGTAWGQGKFANRYQGSPVADEEKKIWAFYRYHIPDPIYFHENFKVTVQQIGGGPIAEVRKLVKKKVPLKLISVDDNGRFFPLLESKSLPDIMDDAFPEGWVNFYRRDDWSSTAYFYLDEPVNDLPALDPAKRRVKDLRF